MSGQSTSSPKAEDATIKRSNVLALQNSFSTISLISGFDAAVNKSISQMPKRFGKPAESVMFGPNFLLRVVYVLTHCCNVQQNKTVFGIFDGCFTDSSANSEQISSTLEHGLTKHLMLSLSGCKPMTMGSLSKSLSVTKSKVSFVAVAVSAKMLMVRGTMFLRIPISE